MNTGPWQLEASATKAAVQFSHADPSRRHKVEDPCVHEFKFKLQVDVTPAAPGLLVVVLAYHDQIVSELKGPKRFNTATDSEVIMKTKTGRAQADGQEL